MKQRSSRGFDGHYFNFPEESATYWMSRFSLPEGSRLVLRGRYPHARYISLNSYSEAVPTDALSDIVIRPDRGSTNPFLPGHRRDLRRRALAGAGARPGAAPRRRAAHPQHPLRAADRRRRDRGLLPRL